MKFRKYSKVLSVIYFFLATHSFESYGASITQDWISKDKSKATIVISGGETKKLPKKGGGEVTIGCKGAISCTVTIADFKDKEGTVTYDNNLSSLQKLSGTIDKGVATFNVATTGNLVGLFSNSTVTANLVESTGFAATIGLPGDQMPQGGAISFSTRWFSDDIIGIDPVTSDEIVLGDFFLDSIDPLTAFEYNIIDSNIPLLATAFTVGQQYKFSTGLKISGEVTENMSAVPLPGALPLLFFGLVSLLGLSRTKFRLHETV